MSAHRFLAALLVLLALHFVPGVGVGYARAATSEAQAIAQCLASDAEGYCYGPTVSGSNANYRSCPKSGSVNPAYSGKIFPSYQAQFGSCSSGSGNYSYPLSASCQNGPWYGTGGCYPDQSECLAKPPLDGQTFLGAVMVNRLAHEGCEYVPSSDSVSVCLDDGPTPVCISPKKWRPSGNAASPGDPAPTTNPSDATCADAGGGMTMCVKQNGNHCYSATTGRQICWRPGETGEKVDGPILQKRIAGPMVGPTVGTPGRTPPYGAMYEPAAAGVEIMTEYGWFRDEGEGQAPTPGTPTQMTTTTQNFSTTNNVNAGGTDPDQGENTNGTPGATPGNQGPGGTAGGGGEGEGGGGVVDKLGDFWDGLVGDGQDHAGDGAQEGDTDIFGDDEVIDGSVLDDSGWIGGGGTCPALWESPGTEGLAASFAISTPSQWCDFIGWIYLAVVAFATITGITILLTGRGD